MPTDAPAMPAESVGAGPPPFRIILAPQNGDMALLIGLALIAAVVCLVLDRRSRRRFRR